MEFRAIKRLAKLSYISTISHNYPFSTNVPIMDKPGSWFLLAKCLKNTCGRSDILRKDAGKKMRVDELHFYLKCHSSTLFQTFC